jgi:hypothetical protein
VCKNGENYCVKEEIVVRIMYIERGHKYYWIRYDLSAGLSVYCCVVVAIRGAWR